MKNVIRRDDVADLGADDYFAIYKQILASILPPSMICGEGYLREPDGDGEAITIIPPPLGRRSMLSALFAALKGGSAAEEKRGASYDSGIAWRLARMLLEDAKGGLSGKEYEAAVRIVTEGLTKERRDDVISLIGQNRSSSIHHETFHDIQGYLLDYHVPVYKALQSAVKDERQAIEGWYEDPGTQSWRTSNDYRFEHIFPACWPDSPDPYEWAMRLMHGLVYRFTQTRLSDAARILGETLAMELGRAEAIPVLLAAAAEGDPGSRGILGRVFGSAGLNPEFYEAMPKFL